MRVQSLGGEDPLEEGMATYSSVLAWRIPWTQEPGGLQSIGSQSQIQLKWLSAQTHTQICVCVCVCVCVTTVKYPKLNPLSFLFHATLSISLYSFCCYPHISSSSTTIWLCLLIYSPPFLCLCLAYYSSPSFFVSKVNILGSEFILLRFKYWLPLSGCVLGKFCCGDVPSKRDC